MKPVIGLNVLVTPEQRNVRVGQLMELTNLRLRKTRELVSV